MLDDDNPTGSDTPAAAAPVHTDGAEDAPPAKKTAARKTAAKKTAAKKAPAKRVAAKKAAAAPAAAGEPGEAAATDGKPARKTTRKAAAKKTTPAKKPAAAESAATGSPETTDQTTDQTTEQATQTEASRPPAIVPLFQAPDASAAPLPRKRAAKKSVAAADDTATDNPERDEPPKDKPGRRGSSRSRTKADESSYDEASTGSGPDVGRSEAQSEAQSEARDDGQGDRSDRQDSSQDPDEGDDGDDSGTKRRPRRRGGRRRRKPDGEGDDSEGSDSDDGQSGDQSDDEGDDSGSTSSASRRRRRRRRPGDEGPSGADDPEKTVTRVRKTRSPEDEITSLQGSTRLEAKKQRRREGREAGRRRAPIVSEAEFLARREAVDRVMVVRQRDDLTQIGVIEDKVLVEHYVARESQTSLIGNVYLGRVQNVLPSMEAAFIDIGKGRNAVLYAGEVNWTSLGAKDNQPRKIESFLRSGQPVLVQVTKDPIGHKGARLTSQVSLPGRFLVYVPDGTTSGISRKLPENERIRLKTLLKEIVPDTAGVIVRTAAEGASEEELTQDVERLTARWGDIEAKVKGGQSPQLLYGEPDLTLKVVRDLFTEDFTKLVVQGDDAWDLVDNYVQHVAPDLQDRLECFRPEEDGNGTDLFATYRLDEQIAKGLDRKVWLPSGGSLIIDRTEAMTVVDVNTGKFTGSGGNLEETVTKNNLEAAEEMVRQLRLRDIGGIIVIDFIDMVLESNRDLVLRRMVECLGRDRTRHQVAEVTSLGLVQMTRKRIGTGLLEAFSEECEHCKGRGLVTHDHPIEQSNKPDDDLRRGGRRSRGGRAKSGNDPGNGSGSGNGSGNGNRSGNASTPSPKDVAAVARPENADRPPLDEQDEPDQAERDQLTPDSAEDSSVESPVTADSASETVDGNGLDTDTDTSPAEETPAGAGPEPEPTPSEPAPPTVVTTRRRSSRRAAGPPIVSPAEASGSDDGLPKGAHFASSDAAAAQGDGAGPDTSLRIESGDEPDDGEDGAFVLHVPVKRKGSRKR